MSTEIEVNNCFVILPLCGGTHKTHIEQYKCLSDFKNIYVKLAFYYYMQNVTKFCLIILQFT